MSKSAKWCLFFVLGLFLFALDFFTKQLALHHLASQYPLEPVRKIDVFQNVCGIDFSLTYAENTGAAWGVFQDYPWVLFGVRIFLILGLFSFFLFSKNAERYRIALLLILVGAIGNVCDFFLYGHVIDMLHFVLWGYSFPVFNIADSLIFIGTCLVIIMTMREKEKITQ